MPLSVVDVSPSSHLFFDYNTIIGIVIVVDAIDYCYCYRCYFICYSSSSCCCVIVVVIVVILILVINIVIVVIIIRSNSNNLVVVVLLVLFVYVIIVVVIISFLLPLSPSLLTLFSSAFF